MQAKSRQKLDPKTIRQAMRLIEEIDESFSRRYQEISPEIIEIQSIYRDKIKQSFAK